MEWDLTVGSFFSIVCLAQSMCQCATQSRRPAINAVTGPVNNMNTIKVPSPCDP